MSDKLKLTNPFISGVDPSTLHGLLSLSNSPHYVHVGDLIRLIKQNVMMDEFAHSAVDPVKNSLHKEYCKGIDAGLTLLAKVIRDAGLLADEMEELMERHNKPEKKDGQFAG